MGGQVLAPGVVRAQQSEPRPQGRTCGGGRGRAFFLPIEQRRALPSRQAAISRRYRSCLGQVRDCHPSGRTPDVGFQVASLKPGPTGGRRHIRDITEFQTASSTVLNTASFPDACSRAFAALQSGRSAKRPNSGHSGSPPPILKAAFLQDSGGRVPNPRYICQGAVGVELKAPRGAIGHARAQIGMGGHGTVQDSGVG